MRYGRLWVFVLSIASDSQPRDFQEEAYNMTLEKMTNPDFNVQRWSNDEEKGCNLATSLSNPHRQYKERKSHRWVPNLVLLIYYEGY